MLDGGGILVIVLGCNVCTLLQKFVIIFQNWQDKEVSFDSNSANFLLSNALAYYGPNNIWEYRLFLCCKFGQIAQKGQMTGQYYKTFFNHRSFTEEQK